MQKKDVTADRNKSLPDLHYEVVSWKNEDFSLLCRELDFYLDQAIGGTEKRKKYLGFNHLDTMDYVLIAYAGHTPAGCGALREYLYDSKGSKRQNEIGKYQWKKMSIRNVNTKKKKGAGINMEVNVNTRKEEGAGISIEVKRVYVRSEYRNRGVATGILQRLIGYARNKGYQKMLLETGEFLQASCRLYTRFGFERIPNYEPYTNMTESLCMERRLTEIRYSSERNFTIKEVKELYESVNWLSAPYGERLVQAFQKAGRVISAWEENQLVGLVEVLDDGELTAYIHYLLVRPEYQSQGIGERLLEFVKEYYKDYLYLIVISEEKKVVGFYEKSGFVSMNQATPLQILKC